MSKNIINKSVKKLDDIYKSLNEKSELYEEGFIGDGFNKIKNIVKDFLRAFFGEDSWFQALLYARNTGKLPKGIEVFNIVTEDKTKNISSIGIKNIYKNIINIPNKESTFIKIFKSLNNDLIKESQSFDDESMNASAPKGDPSGLTPEISSKALQKLLRFLANYGDTNVLIWGPTGVGKTQIINSVARQLNCDLIKINAAQCTLEDLAGLPSQDEKIEEGFIKKTKDGIISIYEKITGKFPIIKSVLPSFWPRTMSKEGKGGIIFIDELNTAKEQVLNICLKLLDERMVGINETLPPRWCVWAAANRPEENHLVRQLAPVLGRRVLMFTYNLELEDWIEYFFSEDSTKYISGKNINNKSLEFDELEKIEKNEIERKNRNKINNDKKFINDKKDKKEVKFDELSISDAAQSIAAFLRFKPELHYNLPRIEGVPIGSKAPFPTPASWQALARLLNTYKDVKEPYVDPNNPINDEDINKIAQAMVGVSAAREYFAFMSIRDIFPNIENLYNDIINDPKNAFLPPLVTQRLENEEAKIRKIFADDTSLDYKLKEIRSKSIYKPAKTIKELGLSENEVPNYRLDVVYAIINGVTDKVRNNLDFTKLNNIVDYNIKLNNAEVATSFVSSVMAANKKFLYNINSSLVRSRESGGSAAVDILQEIIYRFMDKYFTGYDDIKIDKLFGGNLSDKDIDVLRRITGKEIKLVSNKSEIKLLNANSGKGLVEYNTQDYYIKSIKNDEVKVVDDIINNPKDAILISNYKFSDFENVIKKVANKLRNNLDLIKFNNIVDYAVRLNSSEKAMSLISYVLVTNRNFLNNKNKNNLKTIMSKLINKYFE